ncbi:ParB/RepB/Spo0J family partition protein [candidate division KSB1 bacterium]
MKSKPLGKGLQALFEESSLSDYIDTGKKFLEIPVDKIKPNPLQPRDTVDREQFKALKQSIRKQGLIQPIAVRQIGEYYEIVAGERRWKAVKELRMPVIPAYIFYIEDERHLLEISMIENLHRSDLKPLEIALGYQKLHLQFGMTQQQISDAFSVDRSTVANMMRLLKLPDDIKQSLVNGTITAGHARSILGLPTESEQRKLWQRIVNENLSVRQVEQEVQSASAKKRKSASRSASPKSSMILQLEDRLRYMLGSQVRIKTGKNGGKIEIDYYSAEDLDRLMELFTIIEKKY